jgi:hypothetical protein
MSAAAIWIEDASRPGRSKAVYSIVIPDVRRPVAASAKNRVPRPMGPGESFSASRIPGVVARLVPLIGNEVEHLGDRSIDDKLPIDACHPDPLLAS